MLPFQRIPGLAVVKLLECRLPVHQRKVGAIVLKMAAYAILSVGVSHLKQGVIAVMTSQPLRNFSVAIKTLKGGRARAELVTTGTLRSPA